MVLSHIIRGRAGPGACLEKNGRRPRRPRGRRCSFVEARDGHEAFELFELVHDEGADVIVSAVSPPGFDGDRNWEQLEPRLRERMQANAATFYGVELGSYEKFPARRGGIGGDRCTRSRAGQQRQPRRLRAGGRSTRTAPRRRGHTHARHTHRRSGYLGYAGVLLAIAGSAAINVR